jgi:hypothetical protein
MADSPQSATGPASTAAALGLPLAPVRVPARRVMRLTFWAWRDLLRTRVVTGGHHTELTLRLHGEARSQEVIVRAAEARHTAALDARIAALQRTRDIPEEFPQTVSPGQPDGSMSASERVQWAADRRAAARRAAARAEARSRRESAAQEMALLAVRRDEVAAAAAWAARGWAEYADLECAVYTRVRTGLLGLRRGEDADAVVPPYEPLAAGVPAGRGDPDDDQALFALLGGTPAQRGRR